MIEFINHFSIIRQAIDAQAKSFKAMLRQLVLDRESWNTLNEIAKERNVFIFSGIIRDFLTGEFDGVRDLDFVIDKAPSHNHKVIDYLRNAEDFRKNNFGGMKIHHKNMIVDIWYLSDTWGIKEENFSATPESLIRTAFFNFSSIVYDFNNEKFIYDEPFLRFLTTRTMDIVYEKNPNVPLCLINIYYYQKIHQYTLSSKLVEWVYKKYKPDMDLITIQYQHFGKLIATKGDLNIFFNHLISSYSHV